MQTELDPIPLVLADPAGFSGSRSRAHKTGQFLRSWILNAWAGLFQSSPNPQVLGKTEDPERKETCSSLRGPPGTLDPLLGSLHIASDHVLPSYTGHVPVNGDLPVPRSTNSKHISPSAFWREETMSYNVAPGESGTKAISFAHYLSTFSLTPVSLLTRSRACLILSQSF